MKNGSTATISNILWIFAEATIIKWYIQYARKQCGLDFNTHHSDIFSGTEFIISGHGNITENLTVFSALVRKETFFREPHQNFMGSTAT